MIKIIFDPTDLSNKIYNRISEISEYPVCIKNILFSLSEGNDISITIVHTVMLQWLKNMVKRYPQGTFSFETIDARGALTQGWGIEIPPSISNEDIINAGLLTLDLKSQPGFSFEDTLLAHFYAPIMTSQTFPFTQLPALLEAVNPEQWKANRAVQLLVRTLHARLEEWKNKARSSELRQLIELFEEDPIQLRKTLQMFRVLQRYPSIADALLGDLFPILHSLKPQLQDLPIDESAIPETVIQVTYNLNNQKIQNPEEMTSFLEGMSGLLLIEFETIEKRLQQHPEWITPAFMEKLETKFNLPSHKFTRRLTSLRNLIRPPKPEFPDLSWNVETMLSWATSTYLPYQSWCNTQEEFDSELYHIGDHFSEWLMENWGDIHANSKQMVFNIFPNKAVLLKQPGWVNLVLVIDNLGWIFSEILRELCQERGYFLGATEPYLAMLPSETEISKKCLMAGAVGYQAIDDKTYKGMIEKGWVPYFEDHAFRYISDIGSLDTVHSIDAATYVVNYLAIDKALHKSADEIGMPHQDHIRHLLEKLMDNVSAFIEKHNLHEKIRIHVVSDHGSTRIPVGLQNDLDPAFFKSSGFDTRSHRYVVVNQERFANLADNLKLDCFFLPANDFLNPENVLCARRGNRFIPTDKDFYVHGGILPEEIIVPYMMFEPATIELQNLTVLLKKSEFRYRMETIEIEIGNPNETAIEKIQISFLNSNVESESVTIPLLNGKTNTNLQIKTRFKRSGRPEEQNSLHIRIRFHARGEQYTFDTLPKINIKKMVEEKSTSLFDD
ncbi:MAG: hypothetical protein JEZ06_13050 [Anaerolineaceae bacterium]|nr:hypothetical protein [Anaerolineaceae bacterium]